MEAELRGYAEDIVIRTMFFVRSHRDACQWTNEAAINEVLGECPEGEPSGTVATRKKIRVMLAYESGEKIEWRFRYSEAEWQVCRGEPEWDWNSCEYRVKR